RHLIHIDDEERLTDRHLICTIRTEETKLLDQEVAANLKPIQGDRIPLHFGFPDG
ncbi:hypothetical protein Tco_0423266, partial [Tanacetum coccineum]